MTFAAGFDSWWEKNRRAVIRSPAGFARLVWREARKVPISEPKKADDAVAMLERAGYRWDGKRWRKPL